ncbi:hypothetical protein NCAS_0E03280 [Naumovozyma castellii]|uniref:RRM domain-containing protein n=1 Tax=Naumovozyma castellii TaxID=27288 RepID=G0VFX9_NAUCA|nr:hypothetical protein NCAS_0E03280 [Naumovozyma castellii CBS 4309]CCC70398.1 hypothetical protein NCAS_0E03280 [Naumovozyma castellii CBS 4309]
MAPPISKLPSDISHLFKPGPPLRYFKSTDYPPSKRQTNPNITGVSQFLSNNLQSYLNDFPSDSQTKVDEDKQFEEVEKERISKMNESIRNWDPHNDPNIKDTDPYRTIFIGRLPYDTTELELQKLFVKFGEIEKIRIVRDKLTNKSKGYAFIVFLDPMSSKMAFKEIGVHRGIDIKGRTCIVDIERSRTMKYFKPRRLGGGLGGRGYSNRDNRRTFKDHGDRPSYGFRRGHPLDSNATRDHGYSHTSSHRHVDFPRHVGGYQSGSRYNDRAVDVSQAPSTARLTGTSDSPTAGTTVTTSYRSRTSRIRDTSSSKKAEMPDY